MSTTHALTRKTPVPAGPSPLQIAITFPMNISNNINTVSYNDASGSGTTAYLNGTYMVNCSSSEAFPAQNGCVLCVFNANGSFMVRGRPYQGGGPRYYPRTPNGYIFQGSNDNSTWTALYTQANPKLRTAEISTSTGGSTFSITTNNSFKYFWFIIISVVGTGDMNNTQANCSLCWFGITGDSYSQAI